MSSAQEDPTGARRPQTIVLFSDGTGNSAAKLNKTNVWRLYQALELTPPTAGGEPAQIALYDSGVGSSGFQPLAIVGGVFGFGLKKNVLDLYRFLCRNYQPGDRIFAFGFSRGAFTIRVLVGLILRIGVVRYEGERHLGQQATMAYRQYRRGFEASNLAGVFRAIRDVAIDLWRALGGAPAALETVRVEEIAFVGVWDTVAAYGLPVAEMTRAVDRWIWPLSMPNYVLSSRVGQARHALALDDERDTFHPLLWDEVAEAEAVAAGTVAPGRLQQVWFAGMHSDVGGGYPDDSLAYVSLAWMMDEAAAAGLRYLPGARDAVEAQKNAFGPIHDSRAGMGTYYRYQPRRLSARLEPPDPSTLLMQDPSREAAHGRLREICVHDSVVERIRSGPDGYAPIVLPPHFSVWPAAAREPLRISLADGNERVWNEVWRRRINYFLGLLVTLAFLLMPLLPISDCNGPQCLLAPVLSAVGAILPAFLRLWFKAWADNPTLFLVLVVLMTFTLGRSRALQRSIDDLMSDLLARTFAGRRDSAPLRGRQSLIKQLRTSALYQRGIQWVKWRVAPAAFAVLFLGAGALAAIVLLQRAPLVFIDTHAKYCAPGQGTPVGAGPTNAAGVFETADPCFSTGLTVEAGVRYRLTLVVGEDWRDENIPASPEGFDSSEFGALGLVYAPLRRSTAARWFQPLVTVRDKEDHRITFPVRVQAEQPREQAPRRYSGSFTAPVSGQVFLFVNDVVLPWWADKRPRYYANNHGTAVVMLERLPLDPAGN